HGKEATHEIAPATAVRISAFFSKREKSVKPSDAFCGRARDPEPAEGGGEIDAAGRVAPVDALLHDRADVVDLQVRPFEPVAEPVAALLRGPLAGGVIVLGAAEFHGLLLAGLPQLEAGELAHRLVQPVAGDPARVLL